MLGLCVLAINDEECNEALCRIYNEYKPWMLSIAYGFLKSSSLSEDAVHDVFLKIITKVRKIPTESPEITKSYLYIATRNACADICKRNKSRFTANIDNFYNLKSSEDIEATIEIDDLQARLVKIINSMPKTYSDVLTLHLVHNLKLTEIADLLDIPFRTAQSRYLRGRKIIQKEIKKLI